MALSGKALLRGELPVPESFLAEAQMFLDSTSEEVHLRLRLPGDVAHRSLGLQMDPRLPEKPPDIEGFSETYSRRVAWGRTDLGRPQDALFHFSTPE